MCDDVLKLDFDRWHVDILCEPMQPSWHIEGNPDTDSLPRRCVAYFPRRRVAQSVAYRGRGGGCNLMQSSSRAAGGGRTPDDGNWPDQARIEHSAQIHTYTNTQIHTHTYVHKYTSAQLHLLIKSGLITLHIAALCDRQESRRRGEEGEDGKR